MPYRDHIARLLAQTPFAIDTDLQMTGRPPTMANSEFLTNKEQGDWAETIVLNAINENSSEYRAVRYGRSESLAAGDPGFHDFYQSYRDELNTIGKKPDLLIFKRRDIAVDGPLSDEAVSRAVAAIEVRSSSFLANRYAEFMQTRTTRAMSTCDELRQQILDPTMARLLQQRSPELYRLIEGASPNTFRELDFRLRNWLSSPDLRRLSRLLKELKDQIKILHKRDYLSITPKVEDLALVNRWIQKFNVRHHYLQVFFDKAYVIPFKRILDIVSDPTQEDVLFSVEEDVKNQGKTTIKVNIQVGREILGRIDMPQHRSAMKELERGRLLFYVAFAGGRGYLDHNIFLSEIINDQ